MKKYNKAMMETAFLWSKESYCQRKQVGAILAKKGRILSTGYNGTVTGADNCCEEEVELKSYYCERCGSEYDEFKACELCLGGTSYIEERVEKGLKTKPTVVHAEANAIGFAGQYGIKTKGCTMYVTLSPCIECAKIMKQHGIKKVYYAESYRDDLGVKFLKENGVKVKQMKMDKLNLQK